MQPSKPDVSCDNVVIIPITSAHKQFHLLSCPAGHRVGGSEWSRASHTIDNNTMCCQDHTVSVCGGLRYTGMFEVRDTGVCTET